MIHNIPQVTAVVILVLASSVHVFLQSKRDRRIGYPLRHALMCAIVLWPLSYLCWIFWWPGNLRQAMFGSNRDSAHEWARSLIEERKHTRYPSNRWKDVRPFMLVLGVMVPVVTITVFVRPNLAWDMIVLFFVPATLTSLCVRTTPARAFVGSLLLAVILCSVWSLIYYPVSRIFLMGRVLNADGTMGLIPLSALEMSRLIRGCCFLVVSTILGATLTSLIRCRQDRREASRIQ